MTALPHVSGDSGGKRSGPSRATRVALALLVLAPTGQLLAERFSVQQRGARDLPGG